MVAKKRLRRLVRYFRLLCVTKQNWKKPVLRYTSLFVEFSTWAFISCLQTHRRLRCVVHCFFLSVHDWKILVLYSIGTARNVNRKNWCSEEVCLNSNYDHFLLLYLHWQSSCFDLLSITPTTTKQQPGFSFGIQTLTHTYTDIHIHYTTYFHRNLILCLMGNELWEDENMN